MKEFGEPSSQYSTLDSVEIEHQICKRMSEDDFLSQMTVATQPINFSGVYRRSKFERNCFINACLKEFLYMPENGKQADVNFSLNPPEHENMFIGRAKFNRMRNSIQIFRGKVFAVSHRCDLESRAVRFNYDK